MEAKLDKLNVRKVKITDRNIYTKTHSHVSTQKIRNDVYVNHTTSTDEHERVYYEEEDGKSNYIEVINQQTLLKKDGNAILATIGNELVAYKNEGQTIEFSKKLNTDRKSALNNAGNAFGAILYFICALIPILSLFFLYVLFRDVRNDHVFKEFFNYKFNEEHLYMLCFFINIIGHIFYFIGFNTDSLSVLTLGVLNVVGCALFGLINLFKINDNLIIETNKLKKKAVEEIEKIK